MKIRSVCFVAPFAYPVLSNRNVCPTGGAEIQQVLCGRTLQEAGFRVSFVVQNYGQDAREVYHGMEVLACPFRYMGGSNRHFPADIARLLALLRRVRADVHLMISPQSLLFSLATYRRLFGGRLVKIVGSTTDVRTAPTLSSWLYALGTRVLDQTVFQTAVQQKEGGRNLGLSGPVIPTFVPEAPEIPAPAERDIDVLWVGGCDDNKRPEYFLDLAEALPDARFFLICSPRKDSDQFERIQRRAGALANVQHLANVSGGDPSIPFWSQIAPFYARSRILVSTSIQEGFPNVFLEAWQAGAPVVSLGVDPDDVIQRQGLGRVSGTMERLTADVRHFLENEAERSAAGVRCSEYVATTHATDRIVGKYLDLFDALGR